MVQLTYRKKQSGANSVVSGLFLFGILKVPGLRGTKVPSVQLLRHTRRIGHKNGPPTSGAVFVWYTESAVALSYRTVANLYCDMQRHAYKY